jgi:hypothetical protein
MITTLPVNTSYTGIRFYPSSQSIFDPSAWAFIFILRATGATADAYFAI